MDSGFRPTSADEVREVVAWAVAEATPIEVVGAGSKRAIGRPAQMAHTLDLSALAGVVSYEPEELVLSVKPGTRLAELEALLAAHGQMLAFEPVDIGPLLGKAPDRATIGGVFGSNLAGPRRIQARAVRDHMLGLHAVSGRGEAFKAGGRVVKNVTGYDLSRALAGSWGTLAVATELTLKVLPRPETETTIVVRGLDDGRAVRALAAAMGSSADVSGAAHLPAAQAATLDALGGAGAATLLRLEGFGPSVAARRTHLEELLRGLGPLEHLACEQSQTVWRAIRDVVPLQAGGEAAVWRISVAPAAGPSVVADIARDRPVAAYYDWAGGLVWGALAAGDDAGAAAIRSAVAVHGGGHATLIRASAETRARVAVFQPQPSALAALSERLKAQFDPSGILNPGRMAAGT